MLYADAIEATRRTGDQEDERRLVDALRRSIGELDPADDIGPEERSKFASPLVLRRG
jgi:hypothetical protein